MPTLSEDRFCQEIRDRTADLANLVRADLEQPVPTCPGWTFKQLGTHVVRAHRWAAEIVATRSATFIPLRDMPYVRPPPDPAGHAQWLNVSWRACPAAGCCTGWTGTAPPGSWPDRWYWPATRPLTRVCATSRWRCAASWAL